MERRKHPLVGNGLIDKHEARRVVRGHRRYGWTRASSGGT